jgi:hypothetical protein
MYIAAITSRRSRVRRCTSDSRRGRLIYDAWWMDERYRAGHSIQTRGDESKICVLPGGAAAIYSWGSILGRGFDAVIARAVSVAKLHLINATIAVTWLSTVSARR